MRLIDADKLLRDNPVHVTGRILLPGGKSQNIDAIQVSAVNSAQTADAEPVVHCGECKFRCDFTDGHCECRRWPNIPMSYQQVDPQFDFCSYGERRNDNA